MNAPLPSHMLPEIAQRETSAALIDALRGHFGDRCSTALAVREQHGRDESSFIVPPPAAVVFAQSSADVAQVLGLCNAYAVPVIPFGAGSSLEGHLLAIQGGISLDVSRMNQVLAIDADDLTVTVQPGVTRKQLNEAIKHTGLFFPIDPGADASIGGMCATRASGTNAVRYGTMRENVLALTVVLPDGRVIKTARRARKSSAGYDLTRLFVGSEGTLGVIVEITLRLYGIPEAIAAAVVPFETIAGAVDTTILTIQSGIPVARIELLDEVQLDAICRYSGIDYPIKPTLFLEFHGTEQGVREQSALVKAIADEHGGGGFQWTTRPEERSKLWQARHDAAYAAKALRKGCGIWATDVCVPLSRLAECIAETQKDLKQSFLVAPLVGHVGDGNFHLAFVLDRDNPQELREAERLNGRLVERALAMGGTCTGEHGVGLGKRKYLTAEHGAETLSVMAAIKQALDPDGIMNPGKMLPD